MGTEPSPPPLPKKRSFFWIVYLFLLAISFGFIFTGTLLYTFNSTPVYSAMSSVHIQSQITTDDGSLLRVDATPAYYNAQLRMMQSKTLDRLVAKQLGEEERKRLMAPFADAMRLRGPLSVEEVLHVDREIIPQKESNVIEVWYNHPDPNVAATIAQLYTESYIDNELQTKLEILLALVDTLSTRMEAAAERVKVLKRRLPLLPEAEALVAQKSLDAEALIYQELYQQHQRQKTQLHSATSDVSLVDKAFPPFYPTSPNIPRNLSVGFGAGIGVGILLCFCIALIRKFSRA